MKRILTILFMLILPAFASDKLIFGVISTIEPELMQEKLTPLIRYLKRTTGKEIEFKTGYNYDDTINRFANKEFDIGYIGPVPYIKAKSINKDSINILASIENSVKRPFQSVIISKKGSSIVKLNDIKNHKIAFGSPQSTLSYYVPMDMLIRADIIKKVEKYDFLGRHDKVAQYVIMGKYDVGAVKSELAFKYSKYLQIIKKSKPIPDFMIVASSSLDEKITKQIQNALLKLKDKKILHSLKESALGFKKSSDCDYNELRSIVKRVEGYRK